MKLSEIPDGGDAPKNLKLSDVPEQPAAEPKTEARLFGITKVLPESVQQYLPSFLSGPSVGTQLANERQAVVSEEQRLGRPLTPAERFKAEPVMQSPVAMGMATHETGGETPLLARTGPKPPVQITPEAQAAFDRSIADEYRGVIKPTVQGKRTSPQQEAYNTHARSAISSIVGNKPNLRFVDDQGTTISGRTPRSLDEFSSAIAQTKEELFKKYDALAQQAQASGIDVSLVPAANELHTVATDPVIQFSDEHLAKYAAEQEKKYLQKGQLSALDAQRVIKIMNNKLDRYYKSPTKTDEMVNEASVNSLIANQLRAALDHAVDIAAGKDAGYQELKNQYGSLKEIEKHVSHRAQIVGRQEPGGGLLGRLVDVTSATEIIHGVATGNFAAIAKGVGTKAWGEYVRFRRNPNRRVMKMFEEAEAGPKVAANPSPISPVLPQSSYVAYGRSSDADQARRAAGNP